MLYYVVKYLSKIGFRVFFRKIYFHNEALIPKGKPIIFALNHPTAFIDPVLIPSLMVPVVHFIVRGDIFVGKLILAILRSLKMYPIFRFRDGFSALKNNQSVMDQMYVFLRDGKNILILAEGETKHEKRLRPVQKGAARMALGAIEKYGNLDIAMVPIGINYTNSDQFRSQIMVEFGEAILLDDYKSVYEDNPRRAVTQLTKELQLRMQKLVIHIKDEADDDWINALLELQRHDRRDAIFPLLSTQQDDLFRSEKALVEKLNTWSDDDKAKSKADLAHYQSLLEQSKIEAIGVALAKQKRQVNSLFILLGFLPFLLGYLLNFLPLLWAKSVADKKVKKIEFHSSIRYGAGLVGYLIYWLIALIISLIWGNLWGIITVFALPCLGFFALIYRDQFLEWRATLRFEGLNNSKKSDILAARANLIANL